MEEVLEHGQLNICESLPRPARRGHNNQRRRVDHWFHSTWFKGKLTSHVGLKKEPITCQ